LPDDDRVTMFYYRIVRAWEQSVEPLLTGPLATLPMAPLADVPVQDVPRVLERIDARLAAETPPPETAKMMASALTLAGMRLDIDIVGALRGRLRTMNILKDSSFYQVLLKEGKEIGEQEGRIKELMGAIIRLGRLRFGRLPRATRAVIEAIN